VPLSVFLSVFNP